MGDGTFCARREIMGLAERGSCEDTASGIEKAILMGRQARLYPFHWQNGYVWLLSLGSGGRTSGASRILEGAHGILGTASGPLPTHSRWFSLTVYFTIVHTMYGFYFIFIFSL